MRDRPETPLSSPQRRFVFVEIIKHGRVAALSIFLYDQFVDERYGR